MAGLFVNGFIKKKGGVLDHYITQGVGELDQEKLPDLLELKYHSIGDVVAELGSVVEIRDVFIRFQEYLYVSQCLHGHTGG